MLKVPWLGLKPQTCESTCSNVPVNSKTAHPPSPPPPGQTPGHLTFLKNFGQIPCYVARLDCQMPHPLDLQRGSNPPPSRHVKATVLNFFSCVKPFIQMYVFWRSQPQRLNLSQVFLFLMRIKFNEYKRCMSSLVIFYAFYMSQWLTSFLIFFYLRFHNRPALKSHGCFTAYIYLWKKTHSTNNICKQRRSPKNREALNIWILICEITHQWHAASVTPCTHEINEYKQNRLPLETSSAKFSATTNFLFSLSSLHTLNKGIFHDIKTTTTEKPMWNRQEQWPVNAVHVLNQRIAKSFCFRLLTDVLTRKSNAPPGGPHFGSNSPLYGA